MLKRFWLTSLLAACVLPAGAQTVDSQGALWMRIPTDARLSALGGSFGAVNDEISSLDTNPAGLSQMNGPNVALSQIFWAQNISVEHAAFGDKVSGISFGARANYLNFGAIDQFVLGPGGPSANGTITPQAMAFAAGGAVDISPEISAGITGNWAGQDLSNTWDSVVSGNAGLLLHRSDGFSLGLAVLNGGSQLEGFSLPLQVSGGAAMKTDFSGSKDHQLIVAGQWDFFPNSSQSTFSFGAEYEYRSLLDLRFGYTFAPADGDTQGLDGLSAGAGAKFFGFELSYALVTLGSLGNSNQVSLEIKL